MSENTSTIIYTLTDEAPALATYSFLPIIEAFAGVAGVEVETRDISLAGRILATFPERLTDEQRIGDALAELGELALTPDANIIKLPNISASVPQLKAAIGELQAQGYDVPDYPDEPSTPDEVEVRTRYGTVKGSAVNPVLRQGNSDRRAPLSVKHYAKTHPHSMGAWSPESKTHVATMTSGDFRSNEQSLTVAADGAVRIERGHRRRRHGAQGVGPGARRRGDRLDGDGRRRAGLVPRRPDRDAKEQGVLFSLHLKATMMKVSDPIIFGHAVEVFFEDVFAKHGDPRGGRRRSAQRVGEVLGAVDSPRPTRTAIEADIVAELRTAGPRHGRFRRGITNLHVPSDIIVDASMPAMIRTSGQMWNQAGEQQDTLAVIPDSSYSGVYATVIAFCKQHGAFDPATMGSVPNVGLMAQKAEEYGSHDKTFEIPGDASVSSMNLRGDADGACRRSRRHLADVPGEGPSDSRLGETGGDTRTCLRRSGGVLAGRDPGPRRPTDRQGACLPPRPRPRRVADRDHGAGGGDPVLARTDQAGQGHHLGHRQRAARLLDPISSRSSNSARAPRCSRSSR